MDNNSYRQRKKNLTSRIVDYDALGFVMMMLACRPGILCQQECVLSLSYCAILCHIVTTNVRHKDMLTVSPLSEF